MSNDLTVYRGDDKTYNLTFTDSNGDAIDITGYTIFFTVKNNKTDSDDDAVIKKDITSHIDPTNGKTQIILTDIDTAIAIKRYFYDIQLKDVSGLITTVLEDAFIIVQDITIRTT